MLRLRTDEEKQAYVDGFREALESVKKYGLERAQVNLQLLKDLTEDGDEG